jgi:hypothetical protein
LWTVQFFHLTGICQWNGLEQFHSSLFYFGIEMTLLKWILRCREGFSSCYINFGSYYSIIRSQDKISPRIHWEESKMIHWESKISILWRMHSLIILLKTNTAIWQAKLTKWLSVTENNSYDLICTSMYWPSDFLLNAVFPFTCRNETLIIFHEQDFETYYSFCITKDFWSRSSSMIFNVS